MPKILLFNLIISFLVLETVAQESFTIQGIVNDPSGTTLASSTIVILNASDSTLAHFGLTDIKGKFIINQVKTGAYNLQISFLGYEQYQQTFTVAKDFDFGILTLTIARNELDEVVIEGEQTPMKIKKDTIVYNAGAFQTRPNEVVEDLLRKMPGIEVEEDGTVIAQGEEVEQVLVDGKKFFGDDPTIATRNLPADAVEEVEIFDKMSDMSEFTGVDDGERQKTMNLELKEDRKNGYFGTLTAGYGGDNRYNGKVSLNRFNPKLQLSLISNINNVNQQGFSVREYMNFMGSLGGFRGRGRNAGGIPINTGLSNGFVETEAAGLNLNYTIGPKTSLAANYFLNYITNDYDAVSTRENFLTQGSYFSTEASQQINDNKNHRVFVEFRHEIDSTQDVRLQSNFNINDADLISISTSSIIGFSNEKENESLQDYDSFGDNFNITGNLLYRKKLGTQRDQVLTLQGSINSVSDEIIADLESENIFNPDDPLERYSEMIVQNQIQNNDRLNYTLRSSFVLPLRTGRYLEFNLRRQNFDTDLIKDVYDLLNGDEIINLDLSNHYKRDFTLNRGGLSYHINTENASFSVDFNLQYSKLLGNLILEDAKIDKEFFNVLPSLNWRYALGASSNIQLRYTTNVGEPSLEQLQPIIDNSDPLNIYVGNPELEAEYRHNMRFRYFNYNQFNFRSFFATISANYTDNAIVNAKTIDEKFVQTTQPLNVSHSFRLNGNVSYGTPINALKSRINLSTNLSYQNNILFINTMENDANRYSSSLQLRFENRFKKKIDFAIGSRISYNLNTYSANSDLNQDYINQRYFTNFAYNIENKFSFKTDFNYRIYSQEAFEASERIPILGASISYFFLEAQKAELKLSGFDLFNQNVGINRSSNLNYVEYEEVLSLGRYVMLSFTYALRGMGQGGTRSGSGRHFRER